MPAVVLLCALVWRGLFEDLCVDASSCDVCSRNRMGLNIQVWRFGACLFGLCFVSFRVERMEFSRNSVFGMPCALGGNVCCLVSALMGLFVCIHYPVVIYRGVGIPAVFLPVAHVARRLTWSLVHTPVSVEGFSCQDVCYCRAFGLRTLASRGGDGPGSILR